MLIVLLPLFTITTTKKYVVYIEHKIARLTIIFSAYLELICLMVSMFYVNT